MYLAKALLSLKSSLFFHKVIILFVLMPLFTLIVLANTYPIYMYEPWRATIYPYNKGSVIMLFLISFATQSIVLLVQTIYPFVQLINGSKVLTRVKLIVIAMSLWALAPFLIGLFMVILPFYMSSELDLEEGLRLYTGFNLSYNLFIVEYVFNPLIFYVLYLYFLSRRISAKISLKGLIKALLLLFVLWIIVLNASLITEHIIDSTLWIFGPGFLYLYYHGYHPAIYSKLCSTPLLLKAIIPTWGLMISLPLWGFMEKKIVLWIDRRFHGNILRR